MLKSVHCSLGSTDRLLSSRAEILNKNRIKDELAEAGRVQPGAGRNCPVVCLVRSPGVGVLSVIPWAWPTVGRTFFKVSDQSL